MQANGKPKTEKFLRCEAACVDVLREYAPRYLGHHKVASLLGDSRQRQETFCDEVVRRALNELWAAGKIDMKEARGRGVKLKTFGVIPG